MCGLGDQLLISVTVLEANQNLIAVAFPVSHQELQRSVSREEENEKKDGNVDAQSVFLQYPMPYPQDDPSPLLVPQRPSDLMFGNPYSSTDSRGIYAAISPFISIAHFK